MHKKVMTKRELYDLVNKLKDPHYSYGDTLLWCSIHKTLYRVQDGCSGHKGLDLENNQFHIDQFEHNINNNCFAPITLL